MVLPQVGTIFDKFLIFLFFGLSMLTFNSIKGQIVRQICILITINPLFQYATELSKVAENENFYLAIKAPSELVHIYSSYRRVAAPMGMIPGQTDC